MDAAVTIVVSGSSFFSSSVADVETILSVTIIADVMIAAVNKNNFEDGFDRPFCISVITIKKPSYISTTMQKECLWNKNLQNS